MRVPSRSHVRDVLGDQDVLLGALTALALAVEYAADRSLDWWQVAGGLVVAVAVGVLVYSRRRRPLLLLAVTDIFILARVLLPAGGDGVAWGLVGLFAVYTAATYARGRQARVGLGLTIVLVVAILVFDRDNHNLGGVLFFSLLGGAPWVFGRLIRRRRLREEELEQARAAAEAAIVEERARIARELHDVVAHASA